MTETRWASLFNHEICFMCEPNKLLYSFLCLNFIFYYALLALTDECDDFESHM